MRYSKSLDFPQADLWRHVGSGAKFEVCLTDNEGWGRVVPELKSEGEI